MGIVYKAFDPQIDREVALKILRKDRLTDDEFTQRFLKEAKAIGRLSHPNIVTVYDVGQDHGTIYIAMEFLEGRPLDEAIKEDKLKITDIGSIGAQIAEALNYAHQKGVIHRDIKPANIILNSDGRIKITDFGIAQIEDLLTIHQTQAGAILGTPLYMSPEQVNSQPVDGRSDLYSLGVILYVLLTGSKPFTGKNFTAIFAAIINSKPAVPVEIVSGISKAQSELIMKSINKEPDRRFQTGREMAEALKSTFTDSQSDKSSFNIIGKLRSNLLGVFLITVLVVAIMAGGIYYYINIMHTKPEPVVNIKKNAVLQIDSTPNGAQVFMNNLFKGKTPLILKLPLGKYEIRMSLPEYYEWEAELNLDKEEKTPLVFFALFPPYT
ncbi:MAG: serine/threonine protein kinase [Desulfobulbaceae bacterium]|nr:serine/threonine protein kinase [Desulfobulbaceae bacterium]